MRFAAENMSKSYGDLIVLDDFSHVFEPGAITCIMGESGCGKTTLLHMLLGLVTPDSGRIDHPQGLLKSAVFQENRLCENLSAPANVRLACQEASTRPLIEANLARLGLSDSLRKPVRELSGGMKRRVAFVRALMATYDILFLDEPFKGLDHQTRQTVIDFLLEQTADKTVILITHDPRELELLGNRARPLYLERA